MRLGGLEKRRWYNWQLKIHTVARTRKGISAMQCSWSMPDIQYRTQPRIPNPLPASIHLQSCRQKKARMANSLSVCSVRPIPSHPIHLHLRKAQAQTHCNLYKTSVRKMCLHNSNASASGWTWDCQRLTNAMFYTWARYGNTQYTKDTHPYSYERVYIKEGFANISRTLDIAFWAAGWWLWLRMRASTRSWLERVRDAFNEVVITAP